MSPENGRDAINIPREIYERLSGLLEREGTETVDELAARVLRDWLTKAEAGSKSSENRGRRTRASASDDEIVEERLKSLGYI